MMCVCIDFYEDQTEYQEINQNPTQILSVN